MREDFHHCLEEMAGTVLVAQLDFVLAGIVGIVGTVEHYPARIVFGEPVLAGTAPADIAVVHMLVARSAVDHKAAAHSAAVHMADHTPGHSAVVRMVVGHMAAVHLAAGRIVVGHIAAGRKAVGHIAADRIAVGHMAADRTAVHMAVHTVVHMEHRTIVQRQHTGHCWRRQDKADRKCRRRPSTAQDRHHVDHMRRGTPKAS